MSEQMSAKTKDVEQPICIKPTAKRYVVITLFLVLVIIKGFQWICFATITNVIAKFYNVDNTAVNWTTVVFMVTFMSLALPVNMMMEQIGIRKSILIGTIGTTAGLIVKCFSIHRDRFYLSLIGHILIGFAEPFFFSTYSQMAITWFPDNQVGRATAVGLIGDSVGIALGFIVPSLLVGEDIEDIERIEWGLTWLFYGCMVISVVNTLCIIVFFDDQPKYPPGVARFKQIEAMKLKVNVDNSFGAKLKDFTDQVSRFMRNPTFALTLIWFGIGEGAGYAIHTVLNQIIAGDPSLHYPNPVLVTGNVGLILLVAGIFGSIICGALLDRYHSYKSACIITYLLSTVSLTAFSLCLQLNNLLVLYLLTIPLGFSLAGFICCAYEFAVETTYPESELVTCTLLNLFAQVFGILITFGSSVVVDRYGGSAGCWLMCISLAFGLLVTCATKAEYKRLQAATSSIEPCNQCKIPSDLQVAKVYNQDIAQVLPSPMKGALVNNK